MFSKFTETITYENHTGRELEAVFKYKFDRSRKRTIVISPDETVNMNRKWILYISNTTVPISGNVRKIYNIDNILCNKLNFPEQVRNGKFNNHIHDFPKMTDMNILKFGIGCVNPVHWEDLCVIKSWNVEKGFRYTYKFTQGTALYTIINTTSQNPFKYMSSTRFEHSSIPNTLRLPIIPQILDDFEYIKNPTDKSILFIVDDPIITRIKNNSGSDMNIDIGNSNIYMKDGVMVNMNMVPPRGYILLNKFTSNYEWKYDYATMTVEFTSSSPKTSPDQSIKVASKTIPDYFKPVSEESVTVDSPEKKSITQVVNNLNHLITISIDDGRWSKSTILESTQKVSVNTDSITVHIGKAITSIHIKHGVFNYSFVRFSGQLSKDGVLTIIDKMTAQKFYNNMAGYPSLLAEFMKDTRKTLWLHIVDSNADDEQFTQSLMKNLGIDCKLQKITLTDISPKMKEFIEMTVDKKTVMLCPMKPSDFAITQFDNYEEQFSNTIWMNGLKTLLK